MCAFSVSVVVVCIAPVMCSTAIRWKLIYTSHHACYSTATGFSCDGGEEDVCCIKHLGDGV